MNEVKQPFERIILEDNLNVIQRFQAWLATWKGRENEEKRRKLEERVVAGVYGITCATAIVTGVLLWGSRPGVDRKLTKDEERSFARATILEEEERNAAKADNVPPPVVTRVTREHPGKPYEHSPLEIFLTGEMEANPNQGSAIQAVQNRVSHLSNKVAEQLVDFLRRENGANVSSLEEAAAAVNNDPLRLIPLVVRLIEEVMKQKNVEFGERQQTFGKGFLNAGSRGLGLCQSQAAVLYVGILHTLGIDGVPIGTIENNGSVLEPEECCLLIPDPSHTNEGLVGRVSGRRNEATKQDNPEMTFERNDLRSLNIMDKDKLRNLSEHGVLDESLRLFSEINEYHVVLSGDNDWVEAALERCPDRWMAQRVLEFYISALRVVVGLPEDAPPHYKRMMPEVVDLAEKKSQKIAQRFPEVFEAQKENVDTALRAAKSRLNEPQRFASATGGGSH